MRPTDHGRPVSIRALTTSLYRDFSRYVGESKPNGYVVTFEDGHAAWYTVAEAQEVILYLAGAGTAT
jgi:hypothetical protein